MINVAQIGVGYWGPNLLRNLVSNNGCNVKLVVDVAKERRDYVTGLYPNIPVFEDVQIIENDPSIDAVIIATPFKTHYELVIRMIKAGKHVLVEKPLASNLSEVEKIDELQQEKNTIVMVGHTFLYNSAVRYVKKLINSGELGDIRYIYSQRLNLGRIRSDTDALWNFAPHDISIIQYWLDEPDPLSVSVHGMDYVQEGVNDVVFMNITYPGKIMANIHVSWLDPQRIRKMVVIGSKKMVVYDDVSENKIAIYDKGIDRMAILGQNMDYDKTDFIKFNHRSGDVILPKISFEEPLKVEIAHFVDCITKGAKCMTDVEHAKKVIKILSNCNSK
jgi:predicted dehydrogenase